MTREQARRLMVDLGKNLTSEDFCQNIYISTKSCGSRTYKSCSYFEAEDHIFVWTEENAEIISKKEVGDYIIIPHTTETILTLKKVA